MIIGREYGDLVLFYNMPGLEIRDGHADAHFSGFVAAGDDAAIIIAEHSNGPVPEIGPEYPLTGAIEAVTVYDGFHYMVGL
jgi:hypothetical protein